MTDEKKKLHRHNFCLDRDTVLALKEIAWQKRKTMSEVIRDLIQAYVNANRPKS